MIFNNSEVIGVPVLREIIVPIEKEVPYPIEKKVAVPGILNFCLQIYVIVIIFKPNLVDKPVPYHIDKHYPVYKPEYYPLKIPIVKTIVHKAKANGW